jgi:hypothetical protein
MRDDAIDIQPPQLSPGLMHPSGRFDGAVRALSHTGDDAGPSKRASRRGRKHRDPVSALFQFPRMRAHEVSRRIGVVRWPARAEERDSHRPSRPRQGRTVLDVAWPMATGCDGRPDRRALDSWR